EAPSAALNNVASRLRTTTASNLLTLGISQNTAYVTSVSIASNRRLKIGVYGGDSRESSIASTAFGNKPMTIGSSESAAGANHFNGHIYGLIGIGKLTTVDETAAIEKELAKRVGVTLNV